MAQPRLKLPFQRKLTCSQGSCSQGSHNKDYPNTRYALDFTLDNITPFHILASASGKTKIWKCCRHKKGNCQCGLGFGNQIRIYHGQYFTFYAHLSKILIKNNQTIKQGDIIGLSGKTGWAGTTHLHWTLGKESSGIHAYKNFKPFWSIKATKIELKKGSYVSNNYFKHGKSYLSTNHQKSATTQRVRPSSRLFKFHLIASDFFRNSPLRKSNCKNSP